MYQILLDDETGYQTFQTKYQYQTNFPSTTSDTNNITIIFF